MELLHQEGFETTAEYACLLEDAKAFEKFIHENEDFFSKVNKQGISSAEVQRCLFKNVAEARGYTYDQRKEMFVPDFFKPFGKGAILVEVERGRTIENNMDFIDFWKCHIDPIANCLILIIPNHVPRTTNLKRPVYPIVVRRLSPMFTKANYTNVKALAIIPY